MVYGHGSAKRDATSTPVLADLESAALGMSFRLAAVHGGMIANQTRAVGKLRRAFVVVSILLLPQERHPSKAAHKHSDKSDQH